MKARKAAIGMAQRPQRGRDAFNGRFMCGKGFAPGIGQGAGRPGQKGEYLQQFFGIPGRDGAVTFHLARAFTGKSGAGGGYMPLHPRQREARIDQTCQRLEPG